MKQRLQHLMTFIIFMICYSSVFSQTIPDDKLYLGQTPPGNTPVIFQLQTSSGFFAGDRISISSNGKEIYYAELNGYPFTNSRIKCYSYNDITNSWGEPTVVVENRYAPAFSSDEKTLFFEDSGNKSYSAKKVNGTWSIPTSFMKIINMTHYFHQTKFGNYYLASNPVLSTTSDISELLINNSDTAVVNLGVPLNSINNGFDFFIADDETFIIRIVKGNGVGNLFISYHKQDGSWTNPKTLGNVINPAQSWQYGPYVTRDNKYLFYTRQTTKIDICWIKFDTILDSLKHTNFTPYVKNAIPNLNATVNSLFKYKVPDNTFIDDDGNNTLTYTASYNTGDPLPSWLTFNPATRTFSGIPKDVVVTGRNKLNLKVTATDNAHESISCNFSLSVSDQTAIENDTNKIK